MYPGNHTESEMLNVPRNLKTRPDAPTTHLAYITDDEADLLEIYKPDTPHRGAEGIPSYDEGDLLDYTPSWGGVSPGQPSGGGAPSGYIGPTQSSINEAQQEQQQVQQNYIDLYGANEQGQPDMYQPPEEVYGPGQAGVISGETQYNWQGMDPNNKVHQGVFNTVQNMFKSQSGMSTLEFYGIVKKNPITGKYEWSQTSNRGKQLPVEFISQIAEGSIVGAYEGFQNEPFTGTWSEVEAGSHPMFPGGREDYYTATQEPFIVPYTGGSSSGGPGPHYGGGYGGRRGGSGGGGGGGGGSGKPRYSGDFGGENLWGQSHIQRAWINQLRGMNRGGIVSLC